MNELTFMNWNEWIEMNELKWINWNEWIEINDSLAHLFPTSSSKSALNVTVFVHCLCETELSLQYCAPFPDLIFQKCSGILSFHFFNWKSSSRYSPVHFLSTTFPDRAAHPRKQRPSFGDQGSHFTRRNAGFRARECFQTWIHAFPTSYASQLLDNYSMMMWLTW